MDEVAAVVDLREAKATGRAAIWHAGALEYGKHFGGNIVRCVQVY